MIIEQDLALIDQCKDRLQILLWKYQDHIFNAAGLIVPNDLPEIIRNYKKQDPDLDMYWVWKQYDVYIDVDDIKYNRKIDRDYNLDYFNPVDAE